MCGNVGMIGKLVSKDFFIFDDLMKMNCIRGIDGSGIIAAGGNNPVQWVKKPTNYFDASATKDFKNLSKEMANIIIGHTRAATKGGVTRESTHPFEHGSIVGVHNGTLRAQSLLPDSSDFTVDSENIIHSINKIGIEETLGKIKGAAAIVYYDSYDGTLNIIRNSERTLYFCYSEDGDTLYWASEAWMLEGAIGRNGMRVGNITLLEVNTHLKLKFENGKLTQKCKELAPYLPKTTKTVVDKVRKFTFHLPLDAKTEKFNYFITHSRDKKTKLRVNKHNFSFRSLRARGVTDFVGTVNGTHQDGSYHIGFVVAVKNDPSSESFGDVNLTMKEFHNLKRVEKSCAWCAMKIEYRPGNRYIGDRTMICFSCAKDSAVINWAEKEVAI